MSNNKSLRPKIPQDTPRYPNLTPLEPIFAGFALHSLLNRSPSRRSRLADGAVKSLGETKTRCRSFGKDPAESHSPRLEQIDSRFLGHEKHESIKVCIDLDGRCAKPWWETSKESGRDQGFSRGFTSSSGDFGLPTFPF